MTTRSLALSTDLYELTMAAGYFVNDIRATATFELFVRDLPPDRGYLLVAGLEQALAYLETLHFTDEDIAYLRALPAFANVPLAFFDHLATLHFSGEIWAIPEGTPAFTNEPLLRVTAPILEAQLVETALLATINFQTLIASKAARVVSAAAGRGVIEFGSRRAHGTEAAMYAARAAYIGGCEGTSNVEAGLRFGIPTVGTIAHSWVMSFEDELDAFRCYLAVFPGATTLLIDTYDTVEAAKKIVAAGLQPQGVRLDSGDLAALSRAVRRVLDDGGLRDTRIFVSGDLDEWRITELLAAGAPIDAFGVGTRLSTSADQPALGGVYKLVELAMDGTVRGTIKTSPGKATLPGRKQVWRRSNVDGCCCEDVIATYDEPGPPDAEPLLRCVMRQGGRVDPPTSLQDVRDRARSLTARLPASLRRIDHVGTYRVRISERLASKQRELVARCQGR
ncbi:MAG TPA: nicotinate phosphoribosyltransferase [Candidatus Binatia bacterium]|nr:nicotinate phosphoribosyltransferase [Candidatus Binatia bacterium]